MILLYLCSFSISARSYKANEEIIVGMNHIGVQNDSSTFFHSSQVFPTATRRKQVRSTFIDKLIGNDIIDVGIHANFGIPTNETVFFNGTLSKTRLMQDKADTLSLQFFADEMSCWTPVFMKSDGSIWMKTKFFVQIIANSGVIVGISVTGEDPQSLDAGSKVILSYNISWVDSFVPSERRFERFLDRTFFGSRQHGKAILNCVCQSLVLLIACYFLTGLMTTEDAVDTKDFDDFDTLLGDDQNWKSLHGDIFRSPKNAFTLASLVSSGAQISVSLLLFCVLMLFNREIGIRDLSARVIFGSYIATASISGFIATHLTIIYEVKKWTKLIILTSIYCPLIWTAQFLIFSLINTFNQTSYAPGFGTYLQIFSIYAFILLPLTAFGGIIYKKLTRNETSIPNVASIPKVIKPGPWYSKTWVTSILTGVFNISPFIGEFYFILMSMWYNETYTSYFYLFTASISLIASSACYGILISYLKIIHEDYRWQWPSFLGPASGSAIIFIFSIILSIYRFPSSSITQTIIRLTSSAALSLLIGLICGSIGHFGAKFFIKRVYTNLKLD